MQASLSAATRGWQKEKKPTWLDVMASCAEKGYELLETSGKALNCTHDPKMSINN